MCDFFDAVLGLFGCPPCSLGVFLLCVLCGSCLCSTAETTEVTEIQPKEGTEQYWICCTHQLFSNFGVMRMKFTIREIKTEQEMLSLFPLLTQLNPGLKRADYKIMLKDMLKHRYRMAGVFDGRTCVGMSGFWISTKIYSGKYVELDNVVIDKNYRSQGIGKLLCDWIIKLARKQGCKTAMLDAYTENAAGHKFYLREGFILRGFHFLKKL